MNSAKLQICFFFFSKMKLSSWSYNTWEKLYIQDSLPIEILTMNVLKLLMHNVEKVRVLVLLRRHNDLAPGLIKYITWYNIMKINFTEKKRKSMKIPILSYRVAGIISY